jgi:hypothetical protein
MPPRLEVNPRPIRWIRGSREYRSLSELDKVSRLTVFGDGNLASSFARQLICRSDPPPVIA